MAFSSRKYWNRRYSKGRGSSLVPQKKEILEFKSQSINFFIYQNNIKNMLDYGCGDGVFMNLLKVDQYHGVDISDGIISRLNEQYKHDNTKEFYWKREKPNVKYDLVLSMDVMDNLVEDSLYNEYIGHCAKNCGKFLIVSGSNKSAPYSAGSYVKQRAFSEDLKNADFELVQQVEILDSGSYLYFYKKLTETMKRERSRQSKKAFWGSFR